MYIYYRAVDSIQFSGQAPRYQMTDRTLIPRLLIQDATEIKEGGAIRSTAITFHSLNILAFVLVSVVLVTAMTSRKIRRLRTWYTYMWTQLLLSVAFLLHPFKSPDYKPAYAPCLIQAMLVYATPPAYASIQLTMCPIQLIF